MVRTNLRRLRGYILEWLRGESAREGINKQSVTTIRDELRTCVNCAADSMCTVLDILIVFFLLSE